MYSALIGQLQYRQKEVDSGYGCTYPASLIWEKKRGEGKRYHNC